ncbi:peptidoglycan editing factor PgeF [Nibrella saemangeumensis]|uniref:Purine nucleoside phosphorylase n=1 Tax=Nibrella saemangeumensis TaxID=1084526 RepID=A0ABP8NLM9_9BACT
MQPSEKAKELFRQPTLLSSLEGLVVAESTRHGGVSPQPYASLNLGMNTSDDPANVAENRRRFFEALTIEPDRVASSHQIHGADVLLTTEPGRYDGYDALITNQPDLYLAVSTADCVPVLIYDQRHRAVAAVHAGWRGTASGIVSLTLKAMQEQFDTHPGDCYAYVGTCIDETSFDVGPDVAEQFGPNHKRIDPFSGKAFINLKSANTKQLTDFGIPAAHIAVSTFSTVLDNKDYFSHRHEKGQTGRMLAVIGLRPS